MKFFGNRLFGIALTVVLTSPSSELLLISEQKPGKRSSPTDYDYRSLAVDSIRDCVREARKLTSVEERVSFLLSASAILAGSHKNEAIELLDVALTDLKEWVSGHESSQSQRFVAAELRNRVLAQYIKLDGEKAATLPSNEGFDRIDPQPFKANGSWKKDLFERQRSADETITAAISSFEVNPERTTTLLVQSVQQGIENLRQQQIQRTKVSRR